MALKLMYITNNPRVAQIAASAGVDRLFVDMEVLGKAERQGGMNTVQSHHVPGDIAALREAVGPGVEIMARTDPMNPGLPEQIEASIHNGADVIMLPMWRTADDLRRLVDMVGGRALTMPLLETPEAVDNLNEALTVPGIDQMHIGLNDLHLGYHRKFMFELLADGTVEKLCRQIREAGIPYGFGGVGRPGKGTLPAEYILGEHVRLGSSFVILSRSFCNINSISDYAEMELLFQNGVRDIRSVLREDATWTKEQLEANRQKVVERVNQIVGYDL